MRKLTKLFMWLYVVSSVLMALTVVYALSSGTLGHADYRTEPSISNYQGSVPGTSVIVVTWPDGKVDKLVYKDVDKSVDVYVKWFNERYDEYEKRNK